MNEFKDQIGKYKDFLKECRFQVLLPILVFILYITQASLQRKFMTKFTYHDGTALIEAIESNMVHIFQKVVFPSLTYLMSFSYLTIYVCAILLTFLILALYRKTTLFKRFSLMFSLNYLIAFPFFMFFNVSVTGVTLQDVQPLMYVQFPRIFLAITTIDPLDNCFPSLHVAMVFSAFLIMVKTDFKRFKIFLYLGVPTIIFAVLYLGIHWITDVFAGMALALFTYWIAKSFYKPATAIN